MVRVRPYLYVITDDRGPGRGHADIARAAVAGGAGAVQLRVKGVDAPVNETDVREMLRLARLILPLCRAAGIPLIINDRLDVALAAGADGVHLGWDDLPAAEARRLLGPDRILGVSVDTPAEAVAAATAGADYIGVGPVFPTGSKDDAGPVLGPAGVRAVCEAMRETKREAVNVPVVAIGGITPANAADAIRAGADGVAVISAVSAAADPTAAVRELVAAVTAAAAEATDPTKRRPRLEGPSP